MRIKIKKVAVLGSGVMGSGIACHLANAGFDVLLLDIVPFDLKEEEKNSRKHRNRIVDESLRKTIKSRPAPLYKKAYASRITTGNFEDDLEKIKAYDWIIEVIIEDLKIKQQLFTKVEAHRTPGTLISTNTSGIPIHLLTQGRSEDFKKHFLGTHFFNPPRYLRLMEVIPGGETEKKTVDFFMEFGRTYLGKQTVLCKDTPAFIANRVGIFSISRLMELTEKFDFNIETTDALTGPVIGRPKTGTFRLQDLVGIDVGEKVLKGVIASCPDDDYFKTLKSQASPAYIDFLLQYKFLGNKTGQGFYKKTREKDDSGKTIILSLDIKNNAYRSKEKVDMPSVKSAKKLDNLTAKINTFFENDDKGSQFLQAYFLSLFAYVSHRIPEISDQLYSIDDALKAGYAWDIGPFEYWDIIGIEKGIELAEAQGENIAPWVKDMNTAGINTFYKREEGKQYYYNIDTRSYEIVPGSEKMINLQTFNNKLLYKNAEARLLDIGDGVMCMEFTSKSNVIGEGTGKTMQKAIEMAENEGWNGIVIGNNAPNFTVGANLMLVAMLAYQKEWQKLEELVGGFQAANMRLRYSKIPVVTATQGYVFGGGIEMGMHTDCIMAAAESYIGLVEVGVGLLPGGGGTKEFALRLSDSFYEGDVIMPKLVEMFKTIAMAQVATSAAEAFDYKYLLADRDQLVLNTPNVIYEAKQRVLQLSENYVQPSLREVQVLGRSGMATLLTAINEFKLAGYISAHDALIAEKVAFVLCGGDLTAPQKVSEQYLLDIEREAFISLLGEAKTLDRIQHMLQFNKPLRN